MKLSIHIYIATTLAYFLLGDGSMYWAAFNMINILGFIVVTLNLKVSKNIWTDFATNLTIGRIIYSAGCAMAPAEWIYSMNNVFVFIFLTWAIITRIKERQFNGSQK